MDIDIGAKVKEVSKLNGVGPTELGARIETSKQNIYGIFQRKSMDTHLLMKLSIALDHNFYKYYIEELANRLKHGIPGRELNGSSYSSEINILRGEVKHLTVQLELLQELNTMLKEKLRECETETVKQ